jgi:hypothetical protein
MRRRALLAAFMALIAGVGAFGVRLVTADAAPISFSHPGVLVSRAQLDFVKGRVNAGALSWLAAYKQMKGSTYASLSRTPKPRATVECGSYSNPNNGCIAAISHVAETTRIQGEDLWPSLQERMRQALGIHTKFENGTAVPSTICGGKVTKGLGPVTEVAFNALRNRLGIAMTSSQQYTESRRPQGTNNLFVAWETLTHANNPA